MKQTHLYSQEDKLRWWGDGEWVQEPDLVEFECEGYACRVRRMAAREPNTKEESVYGGHLCGYVDVPLTHPCAKTTIVEIFGELQETWIYTGLDVHGGQTYGQEIDGFFRIGFDCGHLNDYIPSMEHLKKSADFMKHYRDEMQKIKDQYDLHDSPIFRKTYRNIDFCIEECKSLAKQLKEKENEVKITHNT